MQALTFWGWGPLVDFLAWGSIPWGVLRGGQVAEGAWASFFLWGFSVDVVVPKFRSHSRTPALKTEASSKKISRFVSKTQNGFTIAAKIITRKSQK